VRRFASIWALLWSAYSFAQDNVLPGYKLSKPPTIDGAIEPAEWEGVPSGQGAFDDETGRPAPENLKFWLAYDENYVYFAAKAFDSQPSGIKATEYRTNASLRGDDNIVLLLDLTGSLADFNEFGMNPRGATSIDLAGGRAAKREWSGEFVAAARITPEGWEVEARIPWKIMRLPTAGPRTVRFNVERDHQRTLRDFIWQYTGSGQDDKAGKWTDVEIPKAPAERSIKLLPYGYAGREGSDTILDTGLDLKTNLAEQIQMVASVNPDFRNIENAILSLDFSRFERLANETRPFFQEGSQYLDSGLFASQRIQDFDIGLNIHGRLSDKMSFGLLDTIDFGDQNSFVANFSYDPTPKDRYRFSATSMSRDGLNNQAYMLRYSKQIGPASVFLRRMASCDSEEGSGTSDGIFVEYFKQGLFALVGWEAVSPDFLPRLGFSPEVDYKGPVVGFEWTRPASKGLVREVSVETFYFDYERYDGGFYRRAVEGDVSVRLENNLGLRYSALAEDFEGSKDHLNGFSVTMPRGNPYRFVSAEYEWGMLEGERYRSAGFQGAYRPVEKLQLTARYQHVVHGEEEDQGILGFNYDLGGDRYASGRLVKRDGDWGGYLSFRQSGNRGVEYYVILGDPNARTFRSSVILKVVWPVEIR